MNGNRFFELYKVKFGKLKFVLRQNVVDDYWVFEGLLFADEYYPLRLKRSDIVLDVGANIGIFTCKAALEVNRVYSIEPEPNNLTFEKER
jgi:predicted RNA methylase